MPRLLETLLATDSAYPLQATRGCPFTCSFCSVPNFNPGFRVRPIDDVIRDIEQSKFPFWWQNKVVWFWGDNLLVRRGRGAIDEWRTHRTSKRDWAA